MTPSERALLLLIAQYISRTQFSSFYPEERRHFADLLARVGAPGPPDSREE